MLEVETVSSSLIPSIWASMNSWLTPTILFIFLNLMIGTIAFTSTFPKTPTTPNKSPSSSVIQRLRSINLSSPFRSQPSVPETHQNDDVVVPLERTLDEVFSQMEVRHVSRTSSDAAPPVDKLPARMRKSASMKSAFGHFKEDDVAAVEARRPATVREGKARVTDGDDEVDAKADDFINRFKNQLKLQRMDSIGRYKEMIGRGGEN